MTLDNRLDIEAGLKQGESLTNISKSINKDLSTVRKEIVKHRVKIYPSTFNSRRNLCVHFHNKECNIKHLCGLDGCNNNCTHCRMNHFCNDICPKYEEYLCETILHKPYCCNGCKNIKFIYQAKEADKEYHNELCTSRQGPRISEEQMNYLNTNVVPRVKKGQSFDSIVLPDDNVKVSTSTLYTYTNKQYLNDLTNLDLPKKVVYRKRNKSNNKNTNVKETVITKLKETRSYCNFIEFTNANPSFNISEMDTVYGNKDGDCKVLLTLILRKSNFMIAILLNNRKSETVNNALTKLKNKLGIEVFQSLFRVLLTDNGSEFFLVEEIEYLDDSTKINLFFCEAGKSNQKGKIEKNHVELRKVLPKGTSFDNLKQEDINLVMSHVNCYKRKKLDGLSPYEYLITEFGVEFTNNLMNLLNYSIINSEDIILKPELLKNT